jgi:hypothetical protein
MGGLFVATILTLLVVPALYALWFRVREHEGAPAIPDAADSDEFRGRFAPLGVAAE